MYETRQFFDQLMSPFVIQPILAFTFSGGVSARQGAEFLKEMLFNMFIAEPQNAIQDVMEINFGFEIESVAGVSVDSIKKKESEEQKEGTSQ